MLMAGQGRGLLQTRGLFRFFRFFRVLQKRNDRVDRSPYTSSEVKYAQPKVVD
jgi:hypothetical protein